MDPRLTSVGILVNVPTHVKCAANGSPNVAMSALIRLYMSRLNLFRASLKVAASILRSWETSRCGRAAVPLRTAIDSFLVSSKQIPLRDSAKSDAKVCINA